MQENYLINWWYSAPNKIEKHTEWIVLLRWHKSIAYLCIWNLEFQPLQIFSPGFELNGELLIAFNLVIISFVCFLMQWKRSIKRFSSTSAPPPSHPKKNYLGYFEFRGMNSTEIYPILVHAFVYQRNPDLHLTFITIPLCIEIGASASWDILSCVCIWKQTLCCRYLQHHNILGQFPTTTNI